MADDHEYGFGTRAIHAGAIPDPVTGARAGVHRERHVARGGEEVDDVLTDDLLRREAGRPEPLRVRAEDVAVGSDEATPDGSVVEEEVG